MDRPVVYSKEVENILDATIKRANSLRDEYAMPEHMLLVLLEEENFKQTVETCGGDLDRIKGLLEDFLSSQEKRDVTDDSDSAINEHEEEVGFSIQMSEVLRTAANAVLNSGRAKILVTHLVKGMFDLQESMAVYALLSSIECDEASFMSELVSAYDPVAGFFDANIEDEDEEDFQCEGFADPSHASGSHEGSQAMWRNFVECVNENLENRNPLVGREEELEQTVRVLSRKDKNNVLHVGDPGVGKTALVYGLARLINEGRVPEGLRNAKIYRLDMGTLLAGTQFRGDFEKRLKMIMDGVAKEENAIVYIDEIHSLVGAGATGEGAIDASNMLKPHLESGKIRFIGSTTYDEYKRYFAKSKGLVRRFSQIDIAEPSVEETVKILNTLKEGYELFHGVAYTDEAIEFAVKGSAKHMADRRLPDKAIDLIDEAGAYRKIHPGEKGDTTVDKDLIGEMLAKMCKVESLAVKADDGERLLTLEERISGKVFGQSEAVRAVAEAVLMSKAGLTEENKPLSSLLFVGPTGVGKTEVAKVLASELGVELLRFDMSEYTEKHAVAKLIGSPAGYVGYEDGGLLTDAIRKTPNAVLLLDEIEKAHADIYNILLQVMDYASLTDNKGNKADFRNVVLIMTSNAGAQYAAQSKVGFGNTTTLGDAMMKEVKRTFKPEFINRLSGTVIFNEMNREMASLILNKKLDLLRKQLSTKNVELKLSEAAEAWLLGRGFTKEYGAREMDRVISHDLKPLLMREILFGKLKDGGVAEVDVVNDKPEVM